MLMRIPWVYSLMGGTPVNESHFLVEPLLLTGNTLSAPSPDLALVSNQALSFHPALLEFMQTPPMKLRRASVSLAYLQLAFTFNL